MWLAVAMTTSGALAVAVPFSSQHVISTVADGASSVHAGDVDGDGDLDLISGSLLDSEVAWYENDGAVDPTFTRIVISTPIAVIRSVYAGDVDGDGDLDLASVGGNSIVWYENDGAADPTFSTIVISTELDGGLSVHGGDVDGDGDLDLMSASLNSDEIAWYENDGAADPTFTRIVVSTAANGAFSVHAGDVDGDGDLDLMSASLNGDEITWYENDGAADPTFDHIVISTAADNASSVFAGDVDGDGDLDLISASRGDDTIAWYENDGAADPTFTRIVVSTAAGGAVYAGDVDGDGDLDLMSASADDSIAWYENDGAADPTFTRIVISTLADQALSVHAGDVDGDGDLDLMSASFEDDKIAWYENETIHRSAVYPVEHTVDGAFGGAISVYATDMDGDGDTDILGAAELADEIAWWENTAGDGSTWVERAVDGSFDRADSAFPTDVDGDGDIDILGAARNDDDISWWENTAGDGSAWIEHPVEDDFDFANSVLGSDVDGDGDIDILAAARNGDDITWWENTTGDGSVWIEHTVDSAFDGAIAVHVADVDGDGDTDILGAAERDDDIAWWENTAGDGSAWIEHTVEGDFEGAFSVYAADVDGDGDTDILGAASLADEITWWENTAGDGSAWTEHTVATEFDRALTVHATDVDGDGDTDILGAALLDDDITWWENTMGDGSAWTEHTVNGDFDGAKSVHAADVDGDGDIDILGAAVHASDISWWENKGGQFALPTTDAVTATTPNEGALDVLVLAIDGEHRGRSGDREGELATILLLFEESPGGPLSNMEFFALVDVPRFYVDDGDGAFEPGTDDVELALGGPIFALDGLVGVTFVDGDPNVEISLGTPVRWWVALDLEPDAGTAVADTFTVSHVTESGSRGDVAGTDIPLTLEFAANVSSAPIAVNGTPTVLSPIDDQDVIIDTSVMLDISVSFGDPEGALLTFAAMGLPSSLTMTPAGVIEGMPTIGDLPGSPYTVTVTATDPLSLEVEDTFTLQVTDGTLFTDGFESGDTSAWSSTVP